MSLDAIENTGYGITQSCFDITDFSGGSSEGRANQQKDALRTQRLDFLCQSLSRSAANMHSFCRC